MITKFLLTPLALLFIVVREPALTFAGIVMLAYMFFPRKNA
jgi:hypothetical protein